MQKCSNNAVYEPRERQSHLYISLLLSRSRMLAHPFDGAEARRVPPYDTPLHPPHPRCVMRPLGTALY
ncbi:hypothetical protein VF21_10338, partial [Pseudogymnoascus sp. 05NY08]